MVNQKRREYQRKYQAKNRDRINERRRERRKRPDVKAKEKEYAQRPESKAKRAAAAKIHRAENLEKCREYQREWRRKNPETAKRYYERNKVELQRKGRERKQKLRRDAIDKLGGKCMICGFDDWRALQIDHINGGGKQEWLKMGSQGICRKIMGMSLEEAKKEYQVLCANHNWIKRHEQGENN